MVGTIAPLVQVAKRQWLVSTSLFVAASTLASAVFGAMLGAVGQVLLGGGRPLAVTALLLAICAALLAIIDLDIVTIRTPTLLRSVPQIWWVRYGPTWGALVYGGVLGLGITTMVPFAGFYLPLIASMLLGPVGGGLIGASYGLGRAVPVPIASLLIVCGVPAPAIGWWSIARARVLARRLSATSLRGCVICLLIVAVR